MTSESDTGTSPVMVVDGIKLGNLVDALAAKQTSEVPSETNQFWSSNQRYQTDSSRDVLEVTFGGDRLINHLSFMVSRFPLILTAEWLDSTGQWQPFCYPDVDPISEPTRERTHAPVLMMISESVPPVINAETQGGNHPEHSGKAHWVAERWKVVPVSTARVRFVLRRNRGGVGPTDRLGNPLAYSLALKDLKIGYRVNSPHDVPSFSRADGSMDPEPFATSNDVLGGRVTFSAYQQGPDKVIDGRLDTSWKSAPQPVNYSVVNLYLDLRSTTGEGQVVDRFYLDPITVGVNCNVYSSDEDPEGDFEGTSQEISTTGRTEVGNPVITRDGSTQIPLSIGLYPNTETAASTGVVLNNNLLRIWYDLPWWVGIDLRSGVDAANTDDRTWLSLGPHRLYCDGAGIAFRTGTGEEVRVAIDPTLQPIHSPLRVVVSYTPATPERQAYLRLSYLSVGHQVVTEEQAISPLARSDSPIKIGLPPGPADTDALIDILGLVVKTEALTPETESWFLDEGQAFVADPASDQTDRLTRRNARLRMHPEFLTTTNIFGVVGGPGDRFAQMQWTPTVRDYTLRRGYLHVVPTRAKFWKFEFTNLVPEVHEVFITIEDQIKFYPPYIVERFQELSLVRALDDLPSGVETNVNNAEINLYSDAITLLKQPQAYDGSPTEVMYLRDPRAAAIAAQTGWIWQYQPWHAGGLTPPQFIETQRHYYEQVTVSRTAKVAFFAGLRELTPFRLDYTFDDDTTEYVEQFLDLKFVDSLTGTEHSGDALVSQMTFAQAESKTLNSYREVRGVQFATLETDAVQVFPDPNLCHDVSLQRYWSVYGDSQVHWMGRSNVLVNRGWFPLTYGDLESTYSTYGDMEAALYGALEGNNPDTGSPEGGMVSVPFTPSGAGRITVVAEVSTQEELSGPISVELISTYGNLIAARGDKALLPGEKAQIVVGYSPGQLTEHYTYGDLENFDEIHPGAPLLHVLRPSEGPPEVGDGLDTTYHAGAPGDSATSYGVVNEAMVQYTDQFNRANGALGADWVTTGSGPSTINTNRVVGGTQAHVARWHIPNSSYPMVAEVTYRGGTYVGPAVAIPPFAAAATFADAGSWYALRQQGAGGGIALVQKDSGAATYTVLAASAINAVTGDVLRVTYDGITVRGYLNSALVLSHVPDFPLLWITDQTGVGFVHGATTESGTALLDDWGGGHLVSRVINWTDATDVEAVFRYVTTSPFDWTVRDQAGVNLFSSQTVTPTSYYVDPGFETGTDSWATGAAYGFFTPAQSFARDNAQHHNGAWSLKVTWANNVPALPGQAAWRTVEGLVAGKTYKWSGWVYVPTGSPDVHLENIFFTRGSDITAKDAWTFFEFEFVSAGYSAALGIVSDSGQVAGNSVYIDNVAVSTMAVTEVRVTIPFTPGTAPFDLAQLLIDVGGAESVRPEVRVIDWWIEVLTVAGTSNYGDLELMTYRELESVDVESDVFVRIRQEASANDSFSVHRVSVYDSPIAWSFSVDDGVTWWPAMDVRDNPDGVVIFPTPGKQLRWRANFYRADSAISALNIRPWYGIGLPSGSIHDMDSLGPNKGVGDDYPDIHQHPMWLARANWDHEGCLPGEVEDQPFWRNVIVNPSGESIVNPDSYDAEGGTVETGYEWHVEE